MCASLILVSMVEFRFPFLLLFCDSSFVACVTVSFFFLSEIMKTDTLCTMKIHFLCIKFYIFSRIVCHIVKEKKESLPT